MTTVWEKQRIDDLQTEEARRHNEQIRERYLRLQNAEETQLAETFESAEEKKAAPQTPAFSSQPIVSPEETQTPAARADTETTGRGKSVPLTGSQKELFGAETFRRMVASVPEYTATEFAAPVNEAAQTVVQRVEKQAEEAAAQVSQAETYSLTSAAKALIAAFAALVVLMLTIIGINTRIMGAKGAELIALETQKAELAEETRALAERIEAETSDEAIARWAAQNGWEKQ